MQDGVGSDGERKQILVPEEMLNKTYSVSRFLAGIFGKGSLKRAAVQSKSDAKAAAEVNKWFESVAKWFAPKKKKDTTGMGILGKATEAIARVVKKVVSKIAEVFAVGFGMVLTKLAGGNPKDFLEMHLKIKAGANPQEAMKEFGQKIEGLNKAYAPEGKQAFDVERAKAELRLQNLYNVDDYLKVQEGTLARFEATVEDSPKDKDELERLRHGVDALKDEVGRDMNLHGKTGNVSPYMQAKLKEINVDIAKMTERIGDLLMRKETQTTKKTWTVTQGQQS